ncbi:MAG TPA: hypothetical protein VFV23_06550 [Verrucomicrobiae bacterium]|nr:hypothetical protein [Verrucomicrobiae bacterium]
MKIQLNKSGGEKGLATILFTVLLAIMMILFVVNSQSLIHLHREIKLLDQQQIKRLNSASSNSVVITDSISK